MRKLPFLLLLLAATVSRSASGASPAPDWFARVWQADDGLPNNIVCGVQQSAEGYLWVSTQTGVARFDGIRFRPLELPGSLPLIRVQCLTADGVLWLALEGGRVMTLAPGRINILSTAEGLPSFRPLAMVQAADHAIWVGYSDGSACRIAATNVTRFTARNGLGGVGQCFLTADRQGQIWFSKAGRVGVFSNDTFVTLATLPHAATRIAPARSGGVWVCAGAELLRCDKSGQLDSAGNLPGVATFEPRVVFEDSAGAIWIGTLGSGLFRYESGQFTSVNTSHRDIECIAEDREMNLWVGTAGGGLNRLRRRLVELDGLQTGLPLERVRSVCEDDRGQLWVVGGNGVLTGNAGAGWHDYSSNAALQNIKTTCVTADRAGNVWVGTYRTGLFCYSNGIFYAFGRAQGLVSDTARALMMDSRNRLWAGLEAGVALQRIEPGTSTTFPLPPGSQAVRTLAEDSAGAVWAGTSDGTVLRIMGEAVQNETSRVNPAHRPVRALHPGPGGSICIALAGHGLAIASSNEVVLLRAKQGLHSEHISALQADQAGSLWFGSDQGIFQVFEKDLTAAAAQAASAEQVLSIAYGRDQAPPNLQASFGYGPNSWRTRDGRVLLAMQTGLAIVHSDRAQPNRFPPPVLVEHILVDGHPLTFALAGRCTLPAGSRRLDVEFTAFNFVSPEGLRFRYRLGGQDDEWVDAGDRRSATFLRLAPGDYTFEVMARNEAGVWGNPAGLALTVQPHLWQTTWARALAAVFAAAAIYWFVRASVERRLGRRIATLERAQAVERERARIARDIHDQLGAGLAQIGLLADLGSASVDPVRAKTTFSRIADRSREAVSSLDQIVWSANPRNDNLPSLADYLCRMADDLFESSPIRCRKDVPVDLPNEPISAELRHHLALAVKEALTNVLRHSQASNAVLQLTWNRPELAVIVEDDGRGFDPAIRDPASNGLSNLASRMRELSGSLELLAKPGGGAKAVFRVDTRPAPPLPNHRP